MMKIVEISCWFSSLLWEVSLRVLQFSPLLKNQHFQIPNRSRTHGYVSPSSYELLSAPMGNKLQYYYNRLGCSQLNYWSCLNLICYTVEPQLNEGPREWQNVFTVTRSFFIYFTITGAKQIVRYTKDFLI